MRRGGRSVPFALLVLVALLAAAVVSSEGRGRGAALAQTPAMSAPLIPPTPAVNPISHRVYTPAPDGSLTVRDTERGALVAVLTLEGRTVDVVVNPDTNVVYALGSTGVVSVIDGATNAVGATVALGHAGTAIGINTITSDVYAGTAAGLAIIDGASNTVAAFLPGVSADPDIAVDEATNRVYLSSIGERRVNVIDGFTRKVIAVVAVGDRPAGVAVDPLNHRIYVANSGQPAPAGAGDSVTIIDGYRNVVVATVPLGREDALGVVIDSASGNVWVIMSNGPPLAIDTATNQVMPPPGAAAAAAPAATPSADSGPAAPRAAATVQRIPASGVPGAAIYNVTIATDASPDLTDLGSLVDSATMLWNTPQEKVWALYYWSHILKRQSGPIVLHGFEVTDPIRNFSDFGFTMCSTVSGINQSLYEAIGLRHQYWDICNHTVSAVEYDGGFHMVDSSMSNLVTTDDGVTLASVEEAAADSARLFRERSLYASSPGGYLTGSDTIRAVADMPNPVDGSTLSGFYRDFCAASLKLRDYYYNWNSGHRYVLNLREDESYTRAFAPLGTTPDYFVSSEHIDAPDPALTFQNDAANKFTLRGNGRWSFSPKLTPDAWSRAVYRSANVIPAEAGGLRPDAAGTPSEVVYKVQAANAITSQHIRAEFARTDALATATISLSVNHGATWTDVGSVGTALGLVPLNLDLRDQVNATYETLVRLRMAADARAPDGIRLVALAIETITQVNTKALAHLNIGRNEIYVAAGDPSDSMTLWPDLRGELWKKDVYDWANIASQPVTLPRTFTAVAYPAQLAQDAYLTYRMDAPTDITRLVYGGRLHNFSAGSYIDFLHSFDGGATWTRSYRLSDVAKPYDVLHYETVSAIPPGVRTVLFKYLLHNTNLTAGRATGLYAVRMEADFRPATETPAPLDVTFRWREVQPDRTTVARSHKQLVSEFPFTYVVDVGGSDHPIMDSVTVNVAAADDGSPAGYSDGVDPGGARYLFTRRTDGSNLARGKPYTISRAASGFQGSAPPGNATILTDGVVGAPATGGASYWSAQCWSSGAAVDLQVDLGVRQTVGAMRAHLLGYPGWDALKGQVQDTVEVSTSLDGTVFTSRGFLQTSLWRKDIPINYMLQDDERATAWNFELLLPAPIPARYVRYRMTPKRTLCASELQVLDHIDYTPFDIRIAPPLAATGGPINAAPSVVLTAPAGGAQFVTPAAVDLAADARDQDDGVQQVDFFAGSALIGSAASSPYAVVWTGAAPGAYTLTARAVDMSGAMTISTPVHVIIARPEDMVAVPAVVGLTQPAATAALAASGLAVGPVTTATSTTIPAGSVISQSPAAGGPAVSGTAVGLVISAGLGGILVPSVIGGTHAAALAALADAGLVAGAITTASSPVVPAGNVINQSPLAGTVVAAGSAVALGVSSGLAAPELPMPWLGQDIGAVGRTGNGSFIASSASFSVTGAGADIWGTADALRYVFRSLDGDGAITARVASVQNVSAWVKAGVMIRADTTAGSAQAMMMVTPSKGNNFQRRTTAGGLTTGTAGAIVTAPYWVRLSRAGSTITASQSQNGSTWAVVDTATLALPSSVLVGLAVSSHVAGTLATATFDHVAVTGVNGVVVPDVVGLTQDAATPILAAAGLSIGAVSLTPSPTLPAGGVISQSPGAGTAVAAGTPVALAVSSGIAGGVVPDVGGLSIDDATIALLAAGLTIGPTATTPSSAVPQGAVISQLPAAGGHVSLGTAVSLVVSTGPATVLVPDVVGLPQSAATGLLSAAGLAVAAISGANSATMAPGGVISQSPAAGTTVAAASAVALVVSTGPEGEGVPVTVPNVVGQSSAAAAAAIADAGLTPGAVAAAASPTVPAGIVIAQSPVAGTAAAEWSLVSLVVSSGPPPVVVPGVVGLTQAAAASALTGAGLTTGAVSTANSATVAAGSVIAQSPAAGASAAPGSAVALLVSSGPAPVLVPNVVGSTQAAAAAAISAAALTPGTVTTVTSLSVAAGSVVSQTPSAGTSVAPGSAVALVVSLGPPSSTPPSPWLTGDVGAVGAAGSAVFDPATSAFTVSGAGADIWGTSDAFRYVYQPLAGDGQIVARVTSVQNTNAWVKAGVMFRASLSAGAAQAMMMVTAAKGNNFQRRVAAGGVTTGTAGVAATAPYWVRLTRSGNTITAEQSADGSTWATVGVDTVALPATALVGLAVSSHSTSTVAAAGFDRVSVGPATWTTPPVISASPAGGTFTGSVAVTLTASRPATIRYTTDGTLPTAASPVYAGPVVLTASTTLRSSATDAAGLQSFDSQAYSIVPVGGVPVPWSSQDVGAVGKTGTVTYTAATGTYEVAGAGADIWGTADAFRFVYLPFRGDGQIVARVVSVQNTNAWVKAGVMIRAGLTAGAAQATMMVTPGKGNNFQRRTVTSGSTTGTAGLLVAAPYWVRLARSGNIVTASQSADGIAWSTVGTDTISLPADALVGLVVSSHATSTLANATFDHVSVGPLDTGGAP